jgi:hypothetical protein
MSVCVCARACVRMQPNKPFFANKDFKKYNWQWYFVSWIFCEYFMRTNFLLFAIGRVYTDTFRVKGKHCYCLVCPSDVVIHNFTFGALNYSVYKISGREQRIYIYESCCWLTWQIFLISSRCMLRWYLNICLYCCLGNSTSDFRKVSLQLVALLDTVHALDWY